eukprot:TRINITY_DN3060_c0_g1_i7.p1 TRINITY_DN3060_c0_g1~~TRINITY_DN3060_c0_g1_i7.p1  ORF type:complete len:516 (+),score=138.49 TRINITY_DN3060_c0_g1_i7:79-1548(+)
MCIRDSIGGGNLMPIYEEFDFSQIRKELENKKIKVKRVIKHKESTSISKPPDNALSNISLNESQTSNFLSTTQTSILLSESMLDRSVVIKSEDFLTSKVIEKSNHIETKENLPLPINPASKYSRPKPSNSRKINNGLYQSSCTSIRERENVFREPCSSAGEIRSERSGSVQPFKTSEPVKINIPSNEDYFRCQKPPVFPTHQRDNSQTRAPHSKKTNPMYWSQSTSVLPIGGTLSAHKPAKQNLFEEFILPKIVSKLLSSQEENLASIKGNLAKEKRRLDADLDNLKAEMIATIEATRSNMHALFDGFSENYQQNYQTLRSKVDQFKNIAKESAGYQLQEPKRQVVIDGISFVSTDDAKIVYNEEKIKISTNLRALDREVDKRLIGYIAEELDKQSVHCPLYNHSESANALLREISANIRTFVGEQLENFHHLVYKTPQILLNQVKAHPCFEVGISNANKTVISNIEKLNSKPKSLSLVQKFSTDHWLH